MKKIILKIFYFLSFVPAVCIIGSLIYFYFADGIGWPGGGASTGFDIVVLVLFLLFGAYWFITIPILAVCLIYQIFYRIKIRKK